MIEYDINKLPQGAEYDPPERIVAARNNYGKLIVVGVRHGSDDMYSLYDHIDDELTFDVCPSSKCEQGFITSKYRFITRTEAWRIAVDQQQIVRRVGGDDSDGGTLYSENLY